MADSRLKNLLSDTVIFAVGNLFVKLIQFVLLPLYTANMSASEYGQAELINNLVELFFPLACLGIYEALFRFSFDRNVDLRSLVTNSLIVWAGSSALVAFVIAIATWIWCFDYSWFVCILVPLYSLRLMVAQFARGNNLIRSFAFSGILNSLALFVATYFMVSYFQWGIDGYLWALVFSNGVAAAYLIVRTHFWSYFSFYFNAHLLKLMLVYALPLIPNSVAWWFNNLSNRYVVQYFCGIEAAGLFVAATKLPAVINMFTQVFQQSWQISAVHSLGVEDRDIYCSRVFRGYAISMMLVSSVAIILSPYFSNLMLVGEFYSANRYIPLLVFGLFFNSLASFLGAFYAATKESFLLLRSTFFGALINVLVSSGLAVFFGVWGAVLGAVASNSLIALIRARESAHFVRIRYGQPWFLVGLTILLAQSVVGSIQEPWAEPSAVSLFLLLICYQFGVNFNFLRRSC